MCGAGRPALYCLQACAACLSSDAAAAWAFTLPILHTPPQQGASLLRRALGEGLRSSSAALSPQLRGLATALRLAGGASGRHAAGTVATRRVSAVAAPAPVEATSVPQEAHGFELVERQYVSEYDSTALLYRHKKTGAQLMSVLNADENKTFGVTFRTPVANSKGTPHILEHSVLCGSDKYPIKEPFVELMKGSLNTFLNAFTYPDRTCYPVASTNLQDFYNLVDVYLDAVLHPNCVKDPRIFAQEGWHLELDSPQVGGAGRGGVGWLGG